MLMGNNNEPSLVQALHTTLFRIFFFSAIHIQAEMSEKAIQQLPPAGCDFTPSRLFSICVVKSGFSLTHGNSLSSKIVSFHRRFFRIETGTIFTNVQ